MIAPSLGARGRVLADVLAALFEHDRELVGQLNAAQRRLQEANACVAGELADAIHRALPTWAGQERCTMTGFESTSERAGRDRHGHAATCHRGEQSL